MLPTLYMLFFAIEVGSRRVSALGVTRNPDSAWVAQQARNLTVGEGLDVLPDPRSGHQVLGPFDEMFRSEGVKIIETPIHAARANAFAERWVRTVRTECLDSTLVFGRHHLDRVLRIYIAHYNARRPPIEVLI